ncbi:hypothetical protein CF327_g1789 [Tilletia walkeri]|uniref:F-box domain-containing protein n=1 Tax=Tilletia walkeri TaxID=117179 RepID=A0A8X7NE11_9BASI|nr:hypothetical protein CF327_g1789 [Tilletia walkeri]KAE8271972.1 hypothetical protein A4X09_0g368 [Tilletia walkeri]
MPRSLPYELWITIADAAAAWSPSKEHSYVRGSTAWQYGPREHPLVALSQTSRTLRRIAAPLLWEEIALTGFEYWDSLEHEHGIDLIHKLIICLQEPIIRNTITSFNFDIKVDTHLGEGPEIYSGPAEVPTYQDFLDLTHRLGKALSGTKLVNLRFDASGLRPADQFLQTIGKGCSHLQHVELSYGPYDMPTDIYSDGHHINGPEPIHALSQVRSATIGMGNVNLYRELRSEDGWTWPLEGDDAVPYLVKWLLGESIDDSSNTSDNKLVNLKTSAPFLYRHRCLLPAWARFNRISEMIEPDTTEPLLSFADGELSRLALGLGSTHEIEMEVEEDMPWVRAAMALRPALDQLLAESNRTKVGGGSHSDIQPAQVVKMIRSDRVFTPWRTTWFPYDTGGNSTPPYRESLLLADEILRSWRKSAQSRLEDDGPPTRWLTGW